MKDWRQTPLTDNERRAIQKAAYTLKKRFPVDRIVLFGSKARTGGSPHSDIDLLLICSTGLKWREEKAVSNLLFEIGMEHDVIFSPLFTSMDEWNGGIFTSFPIFKEIEKEGAVIP